MDSPNDSTSRAKEGCLLIVDDEVELLETLRGILSAITPNIRTAVDGKKALEIFQTGEVDAVLSDVSMPVMDGLSLLVEVRKLSPIAPFVILTSYGDRENLLEAIRLNATDFLEKPFDGAVVRKVLQCALDFGVRLRDLEKDLDESFKNQNLSPDEIARKKALKRVLFRMDYGNKDGS